MVTYTLRFHQQTQTLETTVCSHFRPQTQKLQPPVQHHKQYHRKVLLSYFYLNGHTKILATG